MVLSVKICKICHDGSEIPAHLASLQFLLLVRSRLDSGGTFFANVHVSDDRDRAQNALAARAADVWPAVRILDTPGNLDRNAIVAAGAVTTLVAPKLQVRPQIDADTIESELAAMVFCDAAIEGEMRVVD